MRLLNVFIRRATDYSSNFMNVSKQGLNAPLLQAHFWIGKYCQNTSQQAYKHDLNQVKKIFIEHKKTRQSGFLNWSYISLLSGTHPMNNQPYLPSNEPPDNCSQIHCHTNSTIQHCRPIQWSLSHQRYKRGENQQSH